MGDQALEVGADGAELGRADVEGLARDRRARRGHGRLDQVLDREQLVAVRAVAEDRNAAALADPVEQDLEDAQPFRADEGLRPQDHDLEPAPAGVARDLLGLDLRLAVVRRRRRAARSRRSGGASARRRPRSRRSAPRGARLPRARRRARRRCPRRSPSGSTRARPGSARPRPRGRARRRPRPGARPRPGRARRRAAPRPSARARRRRAARGRACAPRARRPAAGARDGARGSRPRR